MEKSPTEKQKCSLDLFKLIQPELLSVEELVDVLTERSVGPSSLPQNKDKLVSLFKRVALPLPQRTLRQNYRGSLLMKLRKKAERIKVNEPKSLIDSKSFTIGVSGKGSLTKPSLDEKSSADRLKPPPDLVNYERKKIRLSSSSRSSETTKHNFSSNLDQIVIKKRKSSESSIDHSTDKNSVTDMKLEKVISKTEFDRLTINNAQSSSENSTGNKDASVIKEQNGTKHNVKKVSLKRSHFTTKTVSSTPEITPESSPTEPDKKRRPITWP